MDTMLYPTIYIPTSLIIFTVLIACFLDMSDDYGDMINKGFLSLLLSVIWPFVIPVVIIGLVVYLYIKSLLFLKQKVLNFIKKS